MQSVIDYFQNQGIDLFKELFGFTEKSLKDNYVNVNVIVSFNALIQENPEFLTDIQQPLLALI